ncbi:EcsC family protein [Paenibacillus glycanilyticus]|uniref:EcsC family protein n=1 Tax=Paenibacillus glycanilyticus TaxID=126569 RepID=UPI00203E4626|nr:EcsC family protein [Paenibacillus glycanilyticus]MCM3628343.1 EcsC family protein [Paenibacillus glycanilyticus]
MTNTEDISYLRQELVQIEQWEKEQKDLFFWEKLGRLPFALLDRITPKFIQDKIGMALDELGGYVQNGGRYLISKEQMYRKFFPNGLIDAETALDQIAQLPLGRMDQVAGNISKTISNTATVQGASTGIGGIFTLAIDIPLLLGMSIKALQEIAISYGYDPNEKTERIFIVKCLQFSSSDIVGKKAILEDLAAFHTGEQSRQVLSQLQGWREVMLTYRDNFGWKKMFQLIPIAGVLFGAYLNRSTLQDVTEAGRVMYRKRRIIEKLRAAEVKGQENLSN